jgi:hypothetical protein
VRYHLRSSHQLLHRQDLTMRYSTFGRTGLFVSELCFGSMTFGGKSGIWEHIGGTAQQDADRAGRRGPRCRNQFFDTADVYAEGDSDASSAVRWLRGTRTSFWRARFVGARACPNDGTVPAPTSWRRSTAR